MKKTVIHIIVLFCSALFMVAGPATAADKTIGVIMTGNIPYYKDMHKAFTEGLAAEGAGKVEVVLQTPTPEPMSWANAVRKLISVGADVIVTYGAPATLTAMAETTEIPIVFAGVYDPQALGIMGKNATGVSSKVPVASLLKNLKGIANFATLGVVFSESEKDTVLQANEAKQLEPSFGFRSARFSIKKTDDIAKIANVDALFLTTGCAAMHCVNNIIGVARKTKIPTGTTIGGGEGSGIILTLSANPQEQGREAAKIAARVIKGAKPASIALEPPKKIDLIVNLKEATDMGLKIPFDLLTTATRVIK
ncbi:MAG: ABC transporter substrate-binding protein [Nitrospirae bacterium]|nr:ABC transporter substrate-binding protein [Nitrospirota bacterium]